jgi:hypothetical protein
MALLSKKEKLELAEIIANAVVTALKENSSNSQGSTEGRKSANEGTSSASQKKTSTKKSTTSKLTIADFEPKGSKSKEGYMNWSSYKAQRTKYCYFVATNGEVVDGKVFGTPWYGKVDFSENSKYYKAKAQYEKKYKYIKVEDRK